jgi:NhaP-type Na+/H+ or K+/H+ antiporter
VEFEIIGVVALSLAAYALISQRLARSPVSGPMLFTAIGLAAVAAVGFERAEELDHVASRVLEVTLALVLFTDAMTLHVSSWREDGELPGRLLLIGMPLTIALGTIVAALMYGSLGIWEAAILATLLAPTDAALGRAVVTNPRVPIRIRQALNVESGLNDGLALPVLLFFIAAAEAREGANFLTLLAQGIGVGLVAGLVIGIGGAWLMRVSSEKGWMGRTWRQILVVALALMAFAAATFGHFVEEDYPNVGDFGEDLAEGMTMIAFMIFGGILLERALPAIGIREIVFALLALTVIRMVPVAISMIGSRLELRTITYLGWFGPRGLASIIFGALVVEEAVIGYTNTIVLVMITTVALSILLHGATAYFGSNSYADWYDAMEQVEPDMMESVDIANPRVRRRVERM